MFKLQGTVRKERVPSDREREYNTFLNDVKYPPGVKPDYYHSSVFAYIFFLWVGRFGKGLIGSNRSFLDYPPQPNPIAVRRLQFEVFSVINTRLARYKVELSRNKGKQRIPRFTLRAIFTVFWDKILLIISYSIIIGILDFSLLLLIKQLMKSLTSSAKVTYLPILHIALILSTSFFKTLMIQHKYFAIDRYQLAITSSLSYALFRLGVSRRREYHNCDCGQSTYTYGTKRRCLRPRDELYLRNFEIQLKSIEENKCEDGTHVANEGNRNILCPAQQSQGYELSNSIYTFFIGDTRSVCKIILVLMNIVEFFVQLGFSWFSIYSEVGKDYLWALSFQIAVLILAIVVKFLSGFLKKLYLPAMDKRVYSSYQLSANVKPIIMQGLEHASRNFIAKRRSAEAKPLFFELFLNYFFEWLSSIVQQISIASITYKLVNDGTENFGAGKAITIIHTIKIVQSYIYEVPHVLGTYIDSIVSMGRLDTYFSGSRPEKGPSILGFSSKYESKHGFKLSFDDASFNYGNDKTPILKNVNLKLDAGDVLIICGHTSSGKSSLIKACMGELTLSSGKMYVSSLMHGRPIYYVPQNPWIPAGTFMSAVLDDLPFDQEAYATAIRAADLTRDVEEWADGHDRPFDENATSLSTGQRMRLNLARMIYAFLITHPKEPTLRSLNSTSPRVKTPDSDCDESTSPTSKVNSNLSDVSLTSDPLSPGLRSPIHKGRRSDLVCIDGLFPNIDLPVSVRIFQNLFGRDGVFEKDNACVILTMEHSKLLLCFQLLRELRLPLHRYKICELQDGEIIGLGSPEEFINLQTPRSSRQLKQQDCEPKDKAQEGFTPLNYYLDLKRMQISFGPLCKRYISYAGPFKVTLAILLLIGACCVRSTLNIIIISWSNNLRAGTTSKEATQFFIKQLVGCTITEICTKFLGTMLWWHCAITAAKKYHDQRIDSLLFNKETVIKPIGKSLTEFTVDQSCIDTKVHIQLIISFSMFIQLCFQIGSIAFIFPYSIFGLAIVNIIGYYTVLGFYIKSTRYAKFNTLESLTEINLLISKAIHSGELIRAYGKEDILFDSFLTKADYFYRTNMFRSLVCNWAVIRYASVNIIFFTALALVPMLITLFLTSLKDRQPGNIGFVLSLFITINSTTCSLLVSAGVLSELMLSLASSHTSVELPPVTKNDSHKPGKSLLDIQEIVASYKNYDHAIGEHTSFTCINGISATAEKGDIIGIVGRTGSGKTSFIQAIRGMLFLDSGTIFIDGVSIEDMPDDTLRNTIGVISQSSFYFEGWTLGDYIDPYKCHTVKDIHWALNELSLLDVILSEVPKEVDNESEEARLERALKFQLKSQTNYVVTTKRKQQIANQINLNSSHLCHLSFVRLVLGRLKYKLILVDELPNIEQASLGSSPSLLKEFIVKYLGHCTTVLVTHDYEYAKICDKLWVINQGKLVDQITPDNIHTQMQLFRIIE